MAGAMAGGGESAEKKWVQAIFPGDPRPVSLFASPDSQHHGGEGHSLVETALYVSPSHDVNRESAQESVCQERNTAMEGETLLYVSPARAKRPPCSIADSMEQGTAMQGDTLAYHSPVCAKRRRPCANRSLICLARVDPLISS